MSQAHADRARRPPPLAAVRAFVIAARHLSLTRAAADLAVTQSAVSRQVRALERDLGVDLFARRGRRLRLTDAGREFARIAGEAIDRIGEHSAWLRARRSPPAVTLSMLPSVAARWLAPRLGDFVAAHPDIDLRIAASAQRVDLERDGIDAAVRYGRGDWPGVSAIHLGDEELVPVCSPRHAAEQRLERPADLLRASLLQGELPDHWGDWLRAAGVAADAPDRGLRFEDANTLLQAAIDGVGVALGRSRLVSDDLCAGRLVAPFDRRIPASYGYWLLVPPGRAADERLARVRDWLQAAFAGTA